MKALQHRRRSSDCSAARKAIVVFVAVMITLLLVFAASAEAHQTMVYCQNKYGQIFTFPNTCPAGMTFVGVAG